MGVLAWRLLWQLLCFFLVLYQSWDKGDKESWKRKQKERSKATKEITWEEMKRKCIKLSLRITFNNNFWQFCCQILWMTVTLCSALPNIFCNLVSSRQPFILPYGQKAWIQEQSECCAAGTLLKHSAIPQLGYKAIFVCHRCPPDKNAWVAALTHACTPMFMCAHFLTQSPTHISELLFASWVTDALKAW